MQIVEMNTDESVIKIARYKRIGIQEKPRKRETNRIISIDRSKTEFKESIKEGIELESTLRDRGIIDNSMLENITGKYFEKHDREGASMFPRTNLKSYTDLYLLSEATIKKSEVEYLVVTDSGILYLDLEKGLIKFLEYQKISRENIYMSIDSRGVLLKEGNIYKNIISNDIFVNYDSESLKWEDKYLSNKDGYDAINITIDKRNMTIKVHHINILMKYGLSVVSMVIWSGASIYVIDHKNGNKRDNRISNLQLIPHRKNAGKRGNEEEHILYNKRYCYDYAQDLKEIANNVESEQRYKRYKQG